MEPRWRPALPDERAGCPACSEDGSGWRAPLASAALEDACSLLRMCLNLARGLSGKEPGGSPRPRSREGCIPGCSEPSSHHRLGQHVLWGVVPDRGAPLTPDRSLTAERG